MPETPKWRVNHTAPNAAVTGKADAPALDLQPLAIMYAALI